MASLRSLAWYVAETLPNSELRSKFHLERQGFTCFYPRYRKARRHARRTEHILAPVFPGYVFVRFDPGRDQWRSINGTVGVRRLVGPSSGEPQSMPGPAMQALLDRCEDGLIKGLFSELEPGMQVRLIAGPFASRLAQIERLDSRNRVHILLDLLGGRTSLSVAMKDIGPVC